MKQKSTKIMQIFKNNIAYCTITNTNQNKILNLKFEYLDISAEIISQFNSMKFKGLP